jgi:hypothetical protein
VILIIEDKHKSSYDHATNSYMNKQWVLISHGPCAAGRTGQENQPPTYIHCMPIVTMTGRWYGTQHSIIQIIISQYRIILFLDILYGQFAPVQHPRHGVPVKGHAASVSLCIKNPKVKIIISVSKNKLKKIKSKLTKVLSPSLP